MKEQLLRHLCAFTLKRKAVVGRCSGDLLKLNWPDVAPALTIEDTEDLVSKNLEVFWV